MAKERVRINLILADKNKSNQPDKTEYVNRDQSLFILIERGKIRMSIFVKKKSSKKYHNIE